MRYRVIVVNLFVCLSACLSVCLFVCLCVFLSVCLSVCRSAADLENVIFKENNLKEYNDSSRFNLKFF